MIERTHAELLEAPCAMIVGTVDTAGVPDATRGWGIEVIDPTTVRLLLSSSATTSLANVASTRRLALTGTHFRSLVSVQLKGLVRTVEPPTPEDRIRFDRFCAGCVRAMHENEGTPEAMIWRLAPPGSWRASSTSTRSSTRPRARPRGAGWRRSG